MDWEDQHRERQEWLESLKAGDEVCIPGGRFNADRIVTIDRLTATQFVVGPHRYRRKDGGCVGSYHGREIFPATDEVRANIRRERIAVKLLSVKWRDESLDRLERIYAILAEGGA